MTQETLEKANDAQRDIQKLEDHLSYVLRFKGLIESCDNGKLMSDNTCFRFGYKANSSYDFSLYNDLLHINPDDFIRFYLLNLENKIKQLKEEFERL